MRYAGGETQALQTIHIPTVEEEDDRRLNRERDRLLKERGAHSARMKSLLIAHGIVLDKLMQADTVTIKKRQSRSRRLRTTGRLKVRTGARIRTIRANRQTGQSA
jgi:hypothetical protein